MLNNRLRLGLLSAALFSVTALEAQTLASVTGGRLTLRTPQNSQSVRVNVAFAQGGSAEVFGFPGIPDGRRYTGLTGCAWRPGSATPM